MKTFFLAEIPALNFFSAWRIISQAANSFCTLLTFSLVALMSSISASSQATPIDLSSLTATDASRRLCSGSLTSEELVSAYVAQIKKTPQLNAFITLDEKGAMKAAREADAIRRKTDVCHSLSGIPVVIKDNIQVRGLPVTAGTPSLKNYVADTDAPVVARLRSEGAIVLGKTNMHELAFGVTGYNPAYRSGSEIGIRNAYDHSRVAGGSSSGNAAALAARMALLAVGTDTGGSVRIPCAFNGCAALRPTVGRYSQEGIVPLSHTRDTAGPMALSIEDVALLDQVIVGAKSLKPVDLKQVRLGIVPYFFANLDTDTRAATDAALVKLRAAGVTLVDIEMPRLEELDEAISFPILFYEIYDDLGDYLNQHQTGTDIRRAASSIASPDVKSGFDTYVLPRKVPGRSGPVDSKQSYDYAIKTARPMLQKLYRHTFDDNHIDALIFPTTPRVAPIATPEVSDLDMVKVLLQNIDPGSNAGIPGLQLPSGRGSITGMPVGLALDGPADSDRRLLSLGLAIENILGRLPAPK